MVDDSYSNVGFGILFVMVAVLVIICCRCIGKKIRNANIARRNIVTPEPAIEMQPPTYEEALQIAKALERRRRRRRRRNRTHNDANNDTQQNETTGDSNTGDSSNDNENNGIHNTQNDSGVSSNLGENSDVILGRDQKDDSNAADDSGVKSGSGDDTIDAISIDSIYYDAASLSSAGGGKPAAPTPWVDF